MTHSEHELPEPFDPMCQRFAKDMDELDPYVKDTGYESREEFVRNEEGTYNRENGHFLCDKCYIKAGMPSSPMGWKCP